MCTSGNSKLTTHQIRLNVNTKLPAPTVHTLYSVHVVSAYFQFCQAIDRNWAQCYIFSTSVPDRTPCTGTWLSQSVWLCQRSIQLELPHQFWFKCVTAAHTLLYMYIVLCACAGYAWIVLWNLLKNYMKTHTYSTMIQSTVSLILIAYYEHTCTHVRTCMHCTSLLSTWFVQSHLSLLTQTNIYMYCTCTLGTKTMCEPEQIKNCIYGQTWIRVIVYCTCMCTDP